MLLLRVDTAESPRLGSVTEGGDAKGSKEATSAAGTPSSSSESKGAQPETLPLSELHDRLVDNSDVTLSDLCVLLYRAEPEEKDDSGGARGCYGLPSSGLLPWAGVMGMLRPLVHVSRWNDTGHPLCGNLRDGMWLAEYTIDRLRRRGSLGPAADWLQQWCERVRAMQPGLRP